MAAWAEKNLEGADAELFNRHLYFEDRLAHKKAVIGNWLKVPLVPIAWGMSLITWNSSTVQICIVVTIIAGAYVIYVVDGLADMIAGKALASEKLTDIELAGVNKLLALCNKDLDVEDQRDKQAYEVAMRAREERARAAAAARRLEAARNSQSPASTSSDESVRESQVEAGKAELATVESQSALYVSPKKLNKKNPSICPKCGSSDTVALRSSKKPSLVGMAAGAAIAGPVGAGVGAFAGKSRHEFLCRSCGARWKVK